MPRPQSVEPCPACADYLGRNYRGCYECHEAVEVVWREDWLDWLTREGITAGSPDEVALARWVTADVTPHVWTIADYALTRLTCEDCDQELGGGPPDCSACAMAFGNLWAPELETLATVNEHSLRVARLVVRHPHRQSAAIAAGWRFSLPAVLAGNIGTGADARRVADWLKEGGDPAHIARFRTTAEAVAWLSTQTR